jgi:hypothetical protein
MKKIGYYLLDSPVTPDPNGRRAQVFDYDLQQGIFLTDSVKNEYRVEEILSHTGTKVIFLTPAAVEY